MVNLLQVVREWVSGFQQHGRFWGTSLFCATIYESHVLQFLFDVFAGRRNSAHRAAFEVHSAGTNGVHSATADELLAEHGISTIPFLGVGGFSIKTQRILAMVI